MPSVKRKRRTNGDTCTWHGGCDRPCRTRNLCASHYTIALRDGVLKVLPKEEIEFRARQQAGKCLVVRCNNVPTARQVCERHYQKLRYNNIALPEAIWAEAGAPLQFLRDNVRYQDAGCLIWPFSRDKKTGRGMLMFDGTHMSPARAMCILAHGHPPFEGAQAAHSCGKAHNGCVAPNHLRWATAQENIEDKHLHGTVLRGEKNPTSRLTESQVRAIRNDTRACTVVAKVFGVDKSTVLNIRHRRQWAWLED